MSSKYSKISIATGVAALALAVVSASPRFAEAHAAQDAAAEHGKQEMGMPPAAMPAAPMPAAPMKKGMMEGMMDGMMGMDDDTMAPMPPGEAMPAAGIQDPMAPPSNADMMGRMRGSMPERSGMRKMASAATLPGFPGASRLYHIGATGFFLDHPRHIALTTAQKSALNGIKQRTLLERTSSDRKIDAAEQSLWAMTATDMPDATRIDAQVRAIEKLRGDQRMAFIRGVGAAGKVLTTDQQGALLGTIPSAATPTEPVAAPPAAMPPIPTMKDM